MARQDGLINFSLFSHFSFSLWPTETRLPILNSIKTLLAGKTILDLTAEWKGCSVPILPDLSGVSERDLFFLDTLPWLCWHHVWLTFYLWLFCVSSLVLDPPLQPASGRLVFTVHSQAFCSPHSLQKVSLHPTISIWSTVHGFKISNPEILHSQIPNGRSNLKFNMIRQCISPIFLFILYSESLLS